MVTTGAEPQKEMSKIQVKKAKESGIGGLVGLMADMISDFYKDRQGQNE